MVRHGKGQTQEDSLVHTHLSVVPGPRWSLCFLPAGEVSAGLTIEASLNEHVQSGLEMKSLLRGITLLLREAPWKEGGEEQAFMSE